MGGGGLKFAKDGKLSKTLTKTWDQGQSEHLWIELIQMEITSPTTVDGRPQNNRQKLKEVRLTLIVKTVGHHVGGLLDTANAIPATNIGEETKPQDQQTPKRLKGSKA